MPIGQGIAGKCAQTGEIINVKNAETDERMLRKSAYEVKSVELRELLGHLTSRDLLQAHEPGGGAHAPGDACCRAPLFPPLR